MAGEIKRTLKQRKFIKAYIDNNFNATEAYLAISPNIKRKNAKKYGCRLLHNLNLSQNELMNMLGMTDEDLGKKLKEGLNADKSIVVDKELMDVDDYPTRQKYLDMAYKLKGTYPAEKHEETRKVIILGKKKEEDKEDEDNENK